MKNSRPIFNIFLFCFVSLLISAHYHNIAYAEVMDDVFFVGEDVDLLTAASGRPEFPKNAPAVARVVSWDKFAENGYLTLADVLSTQSGFFISQKEYGSGIYMRGLSDSVLVLYDGVPMKSDSIKGVYPLDYELSLSSVSKIEIIKGPSSVLWGPDAFSGVVNVVPKKGRDVNGIEFGFTPGAPSKYSAGFFNIGENRGDWEGFLSLNYRSYSDPRFDVKDSYFYELVGNFSLFDFINVSGRYSDFTKNYTLTNPQTNFEWDAYRKNPYSYLKIEGKKSFGDYALRLKGYYSRFTMENSEMEIAYNQKSNIYYGEIFLEKEMFENKGLISVGGSYKKDNVYDAVVSVRGYPPDYVESDVETFKPIVDKSDFSTNLKSYFAQYRHHFKNVEFWAGLRYDDHNSYRSSTTRNIGLSWQQNKDFYVKGLYGTSFRTPYALQLIGKDDLKPESLENYSLELFYKPVSNFKFSIIPFYNKIANHVAQDSYGGYSLSGTRENAGVEIDFTVELPLEFSVSGAFTKMNSWGDEEIYKVLDYIIITPDSVEEFYSYINKDFDYGAENYGNISLKKKFGDMGSLMLRAKYIGSRSFTYSGSSNKLEFPSEVVLDFSAVYTPFKSKNKFFGLNVKNITNNRYYDSGSYSKVISRPLEGFFSFNYNF